MYFDYLLIISLIITISADIFVKCTYSKYSKVKNKSNYNGLDAALKILKENNVDDIYVLETSGTLTDHFDPNNKCVKLSYENFHNASISSVSVAAHEIGHVMQHKENNFLLKIRTFFIPIVNLCSKFSYIVILLGFILGSYQFFDLGIFMMVVILLFQLLTLPIEFDASKKGLKFLNNYNILDNKELLEGKKVLIAAALTYVAGVVNTLIQVIRLVGMRDDRR